MSDQGYTPTTDEEMVERIADTLAYYQCRETNPKADHPIFGYHQFSREQRDWLRKEKREAAEEVARIIAEVRREAAEKAWDEGEQAGMHNDRLMADGSEDGFVENPYRKKAGA